MTKSEIKKTISIYGEYITLGQFLKIIDIVNSGGMVKHFLEVQTVYVNQEKENRRGRKIRPGDQVTISEIGSWTIEGKG